MQIIRDLRLGKYDVLVGINLLREGLDLPEVSLIAILDADKEGFLRSETSLIQTVGRAARNVDGKVIMYADRITDSMKRAIDETARRREIQHAYNVEHNITPRGIVKGIADVIAATKEEEQSEEAGVNAMNVMLRLEEEMRKAAEELRFEDAAKIRDRLKRLRKA